MRISDWSSDVCSSDLGPREVGLHGVLKVFAAGQTIYRPPLTCMVSPFTKLARSEHKNRMTPATSSAVPKRLSGVASSRRSEEHTSELQSLMRISYAVFCLKKKTQDIHNQ